MARAIPVLCLFSVCFGSPLQGCNAKVAPPITGGGPVDIKDIPYQLALDLGDNDIYGAVIISKDWALTTAYYTNGKEVTSMTLRAGSTTWSSGGSVHNVSQMIVHPNYDPRGNDDDYDFSLLQVDPPFEWGPGVAAIPLAEQGQEFPAGTVSLVSGWGELYDGATTRPDSLQAAEIPLTTADTCFIMYGSAFTDRNYCAGSPEGGIDTCAGDVGGPAVIDGVLAGLSSLGWACVWSGRPGLYAKVSAERDWIRESTGV